MSWEKSRAKSCTGCRQVKLRCDLRDTFPAPCSRCAAANKECRKDATFKRVKTRNRVEALEEQLSRAQRALAAESGSRPLGADLASEHLAPNAALGAERQPSFIPSPGTTGSNQSAVQGTSPSASIASADGLLQFEAQAHDQNFLLPWTLESVSVDHSVVTQLFRHFAEFYHPHMPILQPITSLQALHISSNALFWTIVIVASRHHALYKEVHRQLEQPYQEKIIAQLLLRPLNNFLDLQALLLICAWPLDVDSQIYDTTWTYCGTAMNAALQMGLDKVNEHLLFGASRLMYPLHNVDPKYRAMTFMKCFQLSTQLSSFQGVPPMLDSPRSLEKLSLLYRQGDIPGEVIAMTEIQRQVARYTTTLEDHVPNESTLTLVQFHVEDLDRVKYRHSSIWTDSLEINLEAAKLYMFAMCVNSADEETLYSASNTGPSTFYHATFQQGHAAAIKLTNVIARLGRSSSDNPSCASYQSGGCPLLAHPKHNFRAGFFSCCFLLKYLDCNRRAPETSKEAARNAITAVHRVYMQFRSSKQHIKAAMTIEMLGRSLSPNEERIRTFVNTRLGASVMFNALWAPATIRTSQQEALLGTRTPNPTASTATIPAPSSSVSGAPVSAGATAAALSQRLAQTSLSATTQPLLEMTHGARAPPTIPSAPIHPAQERDFTNQPMTGAFEHSFPWGSWDDALFDHLGFGNIVEMHPSLDMLAHGMPPDEGTQGL